MTKYLLALVMLCSSSVFAEDVMTAAQNTLDNTAGVVVGPVTDKVVAPVTDAVVSTGEKPGVVTDVANSLEKAVGSVANVTVNCRLDYTLHTAAWVVGPVVGSGTASCDNGESTQISIAGVNLGAWGYLQQKGTVHGVGLGAEGNSLENFLGLVVKWAAGYAVGSHGVSLGAGLVANSAINLQVASDYSANSGLGAQLGVSWLAFTDLGDDKQYRAEVTCTGSGFPYNPATHPSCQVTSK